MLDPEDFAFPLGGPEPDALVNGYQLRLATLNEIPALEGQGISMAVVNLDPCTINAPHIHPRATEVKDHSRKTFAACFEVQLGKTVEYHSLVVFYMLFSNCSAVRLLCDTPSVVLQLCIIPE